MTPDLPTFNPFRFLWGLLAPVRLVRWRVEVTELRRADWAAETIAPAVPQGARLLDVGSWDARSAERVAAARGASVTCVDVVDRNKTDLPFLTFDGRSLPFSDASFDAVTLLYVLHHSAHADALLREAARVCRPGGVVVVAEDLVETGVQRAVTLVFHLWLLCWTWMGWRGTFRKVDAWHRSFRGAGLELVATERLPRFPGGRCWPRNVRFTLRPVGQAGDGSAGTSSSSVISSR